MIGLFTEMHAPLFAVLGAFALLLPSLAFCVVDTLVPSSRGRKVRIDKDSQRIPYTAPAALHYVTRSTASRMFARDLAQVDGVEMVFLMFLQDCLRSLFFSFYR